MLYIKDIVGVKATVVNTESGSVLEMQLKDLVKCVELTNLPVQGVSRLRFNDVVEYQEYNCDVLIIETPNKSVYIDGEPRENLANNDFAYYLVECVDEDYILSQCSKYDKFNLLSLRLKLAYSNKVKLYYDCFDELTKTLTGVGIIISDNDSDNRLFNYNSLCYELLGDKLFVTSESSKRSVKFNLFDLPKYSVPDIVDIIDCNCIRVDYPCILELPNNKNIKCINKNKLPRCVVLSIDSSLSDLFKDVPNCKIIV